MSTVLEHLSVPAGAVAGRVIRAAIYVRISSDRTGAGLGVARQEEACRALCARLGWIVVMVYCDNDVSAYSGKPRRAWLQLQADIAAGQVDAIACWHVDRLTRMPRELEDVIDLHDRRGVQLATVTGELDLSTSAGRTTARLLGVIARQEAEHKAERQHAAGIQKARAGKPHRAGSRRGYGYQPDGITVIPAEAQIIREAARRVLAGESVRSVARDLNDRAVPSATGKQWSALVLRQILRSGRVSGRREHHGEIMNHQAWTPVISPGDSDRLRSQLSARPGAGRASTRRFLLSGILTCGNCGKGMYARPHENGTRRYVCAKDPGKNGCGTITIMAGPADDEVRDRVLTALDTPGLLAALITAAAGDDADPGISGRLREIDEQREELARDWARKRITRKDWLTAGAELTTEADTLLGELSRSQHGRALAQFTAMTGTVWDRWDTLTAGARRALIQAIIAGIPVHPATSRRWDPARIGDPLWRA